MLSCPTVDHDLIWHHIGEVSCEVITGTVSLDSSLSEAKKNSQDFDSNSAWHQLFRS